MSTPIPNLDEYRNAIATGDASLGALVYWRGLQGVHIGRVAFRMGFEACGLGDALPATPKPEKMLAMAVEVSARGYGRQAKVELASKSGGDCGDVVYRVLMRRDEEERGRYLEESRISVTRRATLPLVDVTHNPAAAPADDTRDELIAAIEHAYGDIWYHALTLELGAALSSAMKVMDGLMLRPGVYFVPAARMPQLTQLKAFVASVSSVEVVAWDIRATSENAHEAKADARAAFFERLTTLKAEVMAFATAEKAEGDKVSERSIRVRAERFAELDAQVDTYADILGDYAAELRAAVAAAKQAFAEAVL